MPSSQHHFKGAMTDEKDILCTESETQSRNSPLSVAPSARPGTVIFRKIFYLKNNVFLIQKELVTPLIKALFRANYLRNSDECYRISRGLEVFPYTPAKYPDRRLWDEGDIHAA